ncbi:hypothetical protein [Bacillus mycoides]|uniref:hypothetical protein n=1 Tax=Bacillus mycoides TaxID=1405 RepID=UPI003D651E45
MYLQEVRIKNFRGFGENQESGDRCYVFKNLDSDFVIFYGFNGFGKSSFFEAVEWCLTDTVTRLEKYNSNYNATELKKSHHLKFYHPVLGNIKDREIYVELKFSNGLQIIRTSKSISHKFGNEDNYESKLEVIKDGREIDEDYFSDFGVNFKNLDQFLNTHFLGQENISSFLRSNSPESRKSIFMKLLSLNSLDSTYQVVAELKSSGKFKRQKDQLISDLSSNTILLKKINQYMESHNFKNIEEYLIKINKDFNNLRINFSKDNFSGQLSSDFKTYIFSMSEIKLEECINFINRVKKEKIAIEKIKQKQSDSYIASKSQLEIISVLEHLEKGMRLFKQEENYSFLLNNDYEKAIGLLRDVREEKTKYNSLKEKFSEKQSKLNFILSQNIRIENYINTLTNVVSDDFWEKILEFKNHILSFEEEFSNILEEELRVHSSPLENFSVHVWEQFEKKYTNLNKDLEIILDKIAEKEQNIKSLSYLNDQYTEVLNTVKNYVINNKVEHCPVCLNSDFSDLEYTEILSDVNIEGINQKLLSIMNFTIGEGSSIIEAKMQENEKLILEKQSISLNIKDVISKIIDSFNLLMSSYNEHTTQVQKFLINSLKENIEHITFYEKEEKQLENRIQLLESLYIEIFNKDSFDKEIMKDINELIVKVNEEIHEWLENIDINYITFNSRPNYTTIVQKTQEIKSRLYIEDSSSIKSQKLSVMEKIKKEAQIIETTKNILLDMDKVLNYSLPDEFDEKFKDYYKIIKDSELIDQKIEKVNSYKKEIEDYYEKLKSLRDQAVESKLKKHPIIGWIYESINPHPFYQELSITNDGRGANFKDKTGTLYLDHIFSNAQLNILALSVFLGLGLSVEDNFNQLFLDDPIQSMDDVNILALIDVFRGIMDSKFKKKKLIISTHDNNFAKLLSIKMRNRKIVQYHFKSYTEEGPQIIQV